MAIIRFSRADNKRFAKTINLAINARVIRLPFNTDIDAAKIAPKLKAKDALAALDDAGVHYTVVS